MSCLRSTARILSKVTYIDGLNLPAPYLQFARGIKPRWIPKTKSKIFYVRKPTPIDPEEDEQLRTMYFHYRAHQRAIRKFLMDQHEQKTKILKEQSIAKVIGGEADVHTMEEQVQQWNSHVTVVREEALAKEQERHEAITRWREGKDQRRNRRELWRAQEKVNRDLEDSKSFITLNNLDTEIEKLLNQRQDYNFAIDKQGNRISDSSKTEEKEQTEKSSAVR